MAKKKKAPEQQLLTREELEEIANDEGEGLSELQQSAQDADRDAEDEVLAALTELEGASEARWQVHRIMPTEKAGFCDELTSTELSLKYLRKKFGPGKYRIKGFDRRGRYILGGMRTITIAELPETPSLGAGGGSGIEDILAILREDRERSASKNRELLLALGPALITAGVPLIQSLFTRKETTLPELIAAVQGIKGLTEAPKVEAPNALGQLDQLAAVMERVKSMLPEPEGKQVGSTWVDLLREGISQVGAPLVQALASRGGARPVIAPPPPGYRPPLSAQPQPQPQPQLQPQPPQAPQPPQPSQSPPSEEGNPMFALLGWFRAQLDMLCEKAAKGSDPALYAEVMADNLPEGVTPAMLKQYLTRADWWQLFCQFHAPVQPHQAWFVAMRAELLSLIQEAEQAQYLAEQNAQGNQPGEPE